MQTEIISSTESLELIAPEWEQLWQRAPGATPFQSPHWLLPWWRRFGGDAPYTVALREEGSLEALAPLYILRDDDTGESLGMLLGTGVTDYLDILVADESSAVPIISAVSKADCQMWDFQQLRPSSPLLAASLPDGWSESLEDHDRCPVLALTACGADLLGLVSTHARKKLRYFRRSIEREGRVSYSRPTSETLDSMLDDLFALHAARWRTRGLPGVLGDDIIQDFHRDVARRMLIAGALRMIAMTVDERRVGVFYGFSHQGTVYYYLSGYDPAFEKLSIGNVLVAEAIQTAITEGAHTFDFLRGAEEYKYAWGAIDRINKHRTWFRSE